METRGRTGLKIMVIGILLTAVGVTGQIWDLAIFGAAIILIGGAILALVYAGLIGKIDVIEGQFGPIDNIEATRTSIQRLSLLDIAILRHLRDRRSLDEIKRLTRLDPQAIGKKIADFEGAGFITSGGMLTEKGYEALDRGF